ncbi:MAG TPA: cbb3-type cytochrome c oxidase subunit I [Gemmatimonadaceae bacterium]
MMEWFVKAFLKASLTWFGLGVTLGMLMAIRPEWVVYRTAHFHMNFLGFITMMIFGVAYHVIPRFTGHALHSRRIAGAQFWISNAGLAVLAGGFASMATLGTRAWPLLAAGGVVSALGAYLFIYNLWRTIDGSRTQREAAARAAAQQAAAQAATTTRRLPVS